MKNISYTINVKLPPDFDLDAFTEQWLRVIGKAAKESMDKEANRLMREFIYGEGDEKPVGFLKDGK
jgi:hypothetical protein